MLMVCDFFSPQRDQSATLCLFILPEIFVICSRKPESHNGVAVMCLCNVFLSPMFGFCVSYELYFTFQRN